MSQDEHAMAIDKVGYVGEPVAAVATAHEATAEAAWHCIEVAYEPWRSLLSIADALAYPEDHIHDYNRVGNVYRVVALEFGDVDEGFHEANYIWEDTWFFIHKPPCGLKRAHDTPPLGCSAGCCITVETRKMCL
jgi:CO/xanthine dehydrogenase Mo-binding subunit